MVVNWDMTGHRRIALRKCWRPWLTRTCNKDVGNGSLREGIAEVCITCVGHATSWESRIERVDFGEHHDLNLVLKQVLVVAILHVAT